MKKLTIRKCNSISGICHVNVRSYNDVSRTNGVILNHHILDHYHFVYLAYLALVRAPVSIYNIRLKNTISRFLGCELRLISLQKVK